MQLPQVQLFQSAKKVCLHDLVDRSMFMRNAIKCSAGLQSRHQWLCLAYRPALELNEFQGL